MQREKLRGEYINEVFPFESEIHIITDGTDMDKVFDTIQRQNFLSVENFKKNGFGWTIVNLERFDINVYEYKPFVGSTYISFKDVKVNFKGREITLEDELSGKSAIVNMQNNDNMCFKWAVMRALDPIDKNKYRITKEL